MFCINYKRNRIVWKRQNIWDNLRHLLQTAQSTKSKSNDKTLMRKYWELCQKKEKPSLAFYQHVSKIVTFHTSFYQNSQCKESKAIKYIHEQSKWIKRIKFLKKMFITGKIKSWNQYIFRTNPYHILFVLN